MAGNKDQSFLTAKEKLLIGIFIATAVTATVTFVVNIVLIIQLKDSIDTSGNDDLRKDLQNRTANLENQMGEAIEKSNTRYDKLLATQRWTKLSNGLHYQVLVWKDEIAFAAAENDCKIMGARLASTGIRNATIRREISSGVPGINNRNTWIGLNQPYGNSTWVWSDDDVYEDADMPRGWDSCSTGQNRHGVINWGTPTEKFYCPSSSQNIRRCICEI